MKEKNMKAPSYLRLVVLDLYITISNVCLFFAKICVFIKTFFFPRIFNFWFKFWYDLAEYFTSIVRRETDILDTFDPDYYETFER